MCFGQFVKVEVTVHVGVTVHQHCSPVTVHTTRANN
ncbi:hypothetical protein SLEP1_g18931 [Rubroshorea leprosula]|uniref:Uncharacterized protein n=1 Tax=Rubroshorea leprosula TaxID=152421 RepID=A0AAV5J4N6_9ROSI|nr:hypothetical protein SLEP1_g18931 [Rubroshorea leprosula]